MAYKVITVDAEDGNYSTEFLDCLKQHQVDGWEMVWLSWSGNNPVLLFSKAA